MYITSTTTQNPNKSLTSFLPSFLPITAPISTAKYISLLSTFHSGFNDGRFKVMKLVSMYVESCVEYESVTA